MATPSYHLTLSACLNSYNLSLYAEGGYVAKSADQVGRRQHDDEITSTDNGIFEKISQALSSSKDLISEAHYLDTEKFPFYITFVCPVLVIPDGTLWQSKYYDDGEQSGKPERIGHISYYVGKDWLVGEKMHSICYTISHLEIVTFSEIKNFIQTYLGEYAKLCRDANEKRKGFS